jgi:hypothetical protein
MFKNLNKINLSYRNHPFHLVSSNIYPIMISFTVFFFLFNIVLLFHSYEYTLNIVVEISSFLLLISLIASIFSWVSYIIDERDYMYIYTNNLMRNLLFGMILFIVSEIMLFVAFFWAFFHVSLSPTPWISAQWPPVISDMIHLIDPLGLPFLNSLFLVASGVFLNIFFVLYRMKDTTI